MYHTFRVSTLRKYVRSSLSTIVPLFLILVLVQSSAAQTMVFFPRCGEAGKTKVCVTGSGWAEPAPPCFYRFFFNGNQSVFPDQPDGLFGPPNRSFIVPAGTAPGNYPIKVELRITSNNQLLQKKESGDSFFNFSFPFFHTIPLFKVVASSADPFMPAPFNTANRLDIAFDPTDVCEVGTCSKIAFIQVGQIVGLKTDGTTEVILKPSEMKGFPAAVEAEYEANTSASKFFLDRAGVRATPYFGGNGAGTGHWVMGSNDGTPIVVGKMDDTPNLPSGPKAAGFKKLTVNFETAVFCVQGPDKGRFYGIVKWKYETDTFSGGTLNTSTFISATKNAQPSGNFMGALNAWLANPNHASFKLPTTGLPQCP